MGRTITVPISIDARAIESMLQNAQKQMATVNLTPAIDKKMTGYIASLTKDLANLNELTKKGAIESGREWSKANATFTHMGVGLGKLQNGLAEIKNKFGKDLIDKDAAKELAKMASELNKLTSQKTDTRQNAIRTLLLSNKEVLKQVTEIAGATAVRVGDEDKITAALQKQQMLLKEQADERDRAANLAKQALTAQETLSTMGVAGRTKTGVDYTKFAPGGKDAFAATLPQELQTVLGDKVKGTLTEIQQALQGVYQEANKTAEALTSTFAVQNYDKATMALQQVDAALATTSAQTDRLDKEIAESTLVMEKFSQVASQNAAMGVDKLGDEIQETSQQLLDYKKQLPTENPFSNLQGANSPENIGNGFKNAIGQVLGFGSAFMVVRQQISRAVEEIKGIDEAITGIAVVTEMTNSQLWKQVDAMMGLAKSYGATTKGVYEVTQLYYQQGLQTKDVMAATTETLKLARISNLSYADSADYITAAVKGYNMAMSEAVKITDVYSNIAA